MTSIRQFCVETDAFLVSKKLSFQNIYYINKKLGTVSWKKPALLYGRKLPKPDKWYVCYDESNIPFYLNPFKDDIKYDAPYDYDGPEVKYIYPGNDPSF